MSDTLMVVEVNQDTEQHRWRCLLCNDVGDGFDNVDRAHAGARVHFEAKHHDLYGGGLLTISIEEALELYGDRECLICHEEFPTPLIGRHVIAAHIDELHLWPGREVGFLRYCLSSMNESIRRVKAAGRTDLLDDFRAAAVLLRQQLEMAVRDVSRLN